MSRVLYSSDVRSLMFIVVRLHPDFAYAISEVGRYMAKPDKEH